MKIGSVILGFAMICIGIVDLAGQAPVLGIHPAVWFILGVLLVCSDSAWARLAKKKAGKNKGDDLENDEDPTPSSHHTLHNRLPLKRGANRIEVSAATA